ncbi:sugar 3,4-ketoisomerase [Pelosinus fermentans]|uniref:WxcM-like domain-containing protein n=1 Tax=Pelosinus fermentans JBW45 TaxID=1192197 RepID=I8TS84_9FIRM|nr:FdtA/QdtA family cupin domain-containing protein [Pelosinus fermentans]AJQ26089.1 WxcM-like domain-containing protein [Pelosinus fermentans JBW45]
MSVKDCHIIEFPKVSDPRGNLTFVENSRQIPFDIKRVFYLYDVPGGETRAEHANIKLQQILIAMSGSFDVVVDDGYAKKTFTLNRSFYGLYIPGMIWRGLENFSSGSICMALTDDYYNATDYYRDYSAFVTAVKEGEK